MALFSFRKKLKKNKKSSEKTRRGFTLVEMAITATIMIIASSMLIIFTQSGGNRLTLTTEQAKIAGVLNRAKSLALQRYRLEGTTACGYAFLFGEPADTFAIAPVVMTQVEPPEQSECADVQEPTETFVLQRSVKFNENSKSGVIIFESPYLTTKNPQLIEIGLRTGDASQNAGVEVTSGGAIIMK
jgi:type II secretory pathway pseudopilin PulG